MLNKHTKDKTNEILIIPIVYGTIAFSLGKKADDTATHKWCVYVRGNNNEDLSNYIKEVSFTLHSTFPNNVRTVSTQPFELYELGWGEFDIKIQIFLHDPVLKVIEYIQPLKLYPYFSHTAHSSKKPVLSESYDEIIIINPRKEFFKEILKLTSTNNDAMNVNISKRNSNSNLELNEDKAKDNENEANEFPGDNGLDCESNADTNLNTNNANNLNKKRINSNINNSSVKNQVVGGSSLKDKDNISVSSNHETKDNKDINDKLIPNVKQHFAPISDEVHYKQLQDVNVFITKEIQKLKSALEENDKALTSINKKIKDYKAKARSSQPQQQ